jgi:hypothetical protein
VGLGSDLDQHAAVFDLYLVGSEVLAGRGSFYLAGCKVKNTGVPRALDGVLHYQPVSQMHVFVRAHTVRAEILVLVISVDGESPVTMIEAYHTFRLDVMGRAGINPFGHVVSFSRVLTCLFSLERLQTNSGERLSSQFADFDPLRLAAFRLKRSSMRFSDSSLPSWKVRNHLSYGTTPSA